uniref:Uncharacterized protein n=1 Tax=Oryza meridionalis TaxID=40149 RepID=A0A0E0DB23_9ORYZ
MAARRPDRELTGDRSRRQIAGVYNFCTMVHACMRWRRDENAGAPLHGARTPSLSPPSYVSAVRRTGEQAAVRCRVRTKGIVMLPRRNTPPQHCERRPRIHDAALAGAAMPNVSPTVFGGAVILLTPWRRRSRGHPRLAGGDLYLTVPSSAHVVIPLTRTVIESGRAILLLVEVCWVNPEKAISVPSCRGMLRIIKTARNVIKLPSSSSL